MIILISHCIFLARPSAPKELKFGDVTRDSVHLTWEPPDDDGGSPLTGYIVEKREVSRKTWTKVIDLVTDLEFTVPDLVQGKEYLFKVCACNKCGPGEPAYVDEPVNMSVPASEYLLMIPYLASCCLLLLLEPRIEVTGERHGLAVWIFHRWPKIDSLFKMTKI